MKHPEVTFTSQQIEKQDLQCRLPNTQPILPTFQDTVNAVLNAWHP